MEFRIQQGRDDVITEWKGPSATFRPGKGLRHVCFTTQQISSIYRRRECDWWLPPACIKVPTVSKTVPVVAGCMAAVSQTADTTQPDQTSIESSSAQLYSWMYQAKLPRPVPCRGPFFRLNWHCSDWSPLQLQNNTQYTIHMSSVLFTYLQTDQDSYWTMYIRSIITIILI